MLSRSLLSVIALILLAANFYIIYEYDQEISRWARLVSTTMFVLLLLWNRNYGKRMLSAFVFLFISDVLLLFYELPIANAATFLMRITAYTLLIFAVVPELRKLKTNLFQKLSFLIVFMLNLAMLYALVDMVPDQYLYPGLSMLFYIYGATMISLVIAAISYSNRYSNKASFFFTAAALCLVFSDITSFVGYYLEFSEFYFPDRFFYILGLLNLLLFLNEKASEKKIGVSLKFF